MAVDQYALTTVALVKSYMQTAESELTDNALGVYCDAADALAASVTVTDTTVDLVITGGNDAGLTSVDITSASNDTLTELVSTIDGTSGWQARLLGESTADSSDLVPQAATNALGIANEVTLKILDTFLIETLINAASAKIEGWLNRNVLSRGYAEFYNGTGTDVLVLNQDPVTAINRVATQRETVLEVKFTGTGSYASVGVTDTTMILHSLSTSSSTTTLTLSDSTSLTALVTAIEAVSGWEATIISGRDAYFPSVLIPVPNRYCLNNPVQLDMPCEGLVEEYELRQPAILWRRGTWYPGFNNVYVEYTAGESSAPYNIQQAATAMVATVLREGRRDTSIKSYKLGDFGYTLAEKLDVDEKIASWLKPYRRAII